MLELTGEDLNLIFSLSERISVNECYAIGKIKNDTFSIKYSNERLNDISIPLDMLKDVCMKGTDVNFALNGERYSINLFYPLELSSVEENLTSASPNAKLFDAIDMGAGVVLLDQEFMTEAVLDLETDEEEDNSITLEYVDENGEERQLNFIDKEIEELEIETAGNESALVFKVDGVHYSISPMKMMDEAFFMKAKAEHDVHVLDALIGENARRLDGMEF